VEPLWTLSLNFVHQQVEFQYIKRKERQKAKKEEKQA
jgi:hypothetical protein